MKSFCQSKHVRFFLLLSGLFSITTAACAEDPWTELQGFYGSSKAPVAVFEGSKPVKEPKLANLTKDDPWSVLQAYYIPFTQADEEAAFSSSQARRKVSGHLHERLAPFRSLIDQAATRFDIPPEVLGAIIMVESNGNPRAKAPTSSAKGLMQTIDSTFAEARHGLQSLGISIANDPYNPKASIMAGGWYLDRMFRQMEKDRDNNFDRNDLSAWRKVAEYYYAGPNHGRKRAGVVIMYAGGKQVIVNKAGYATKVIKWARVMG